MHDEQDMRKMGALRKFMPITAITFIVGWLAIAGVPPFAGFWSKDEILQFAFVKSPALYLVGLFAALLTAYYMTRQVMMVFFGEARWEDPAAEHGAHGDFKPHESSPVMLLPLVVLAGLAVVLGVIQLPFSHNTEFLGKWLAPVTEFAETNVDGSWAYDNRFVLMAIATVVALGGIAVGVLVYNRHKLKAVEPEILAEGWYYDQAISDFMGGPGRAGYDGVTWVDANIIDGAVNGAGELVRETATGGRGIQTGNMRNYAAALGCGAVAVLAYLVVVRGIL
jgi:NADH-quinone oxidoreductase subunit L